MINTKSPAPIEAASHRRNSVSDDEPELPVGVPSDFPIPEPTTGTVDDDDGVQDEQPGENEIQVRETDENTEAPDEFEIDDEDLTDGRVTGD
ncbi:MAG: hypothetical protein ABSF94_14930 [Steroidobacteraceae bacterium]|jgi:hypothetical protein